MIGRGSTPTIAYRLKDIDPATFTAVYLTIVQNGSVVLERDITTMSISSNVISWELTQEETLKFDETVKSDIQIRAKDMYNRAYVSYHSLENILGINKDGVI